MECEWLENGDGWELVVIGRWRPQGTDNSEGPVAGSSEECEGGEFQGKRTEEGEGARWRVEKLQEVKKSIKNHGIHQVKENLANEQKAKETREGESQNEKEKEVRGSKPLPPWWCWLSVVTCFLFRGAFVSVCTCSLVCFF